MTSLENLFTGTAQAQTTSAAPATGGDKGPTGGAFGMFLPMVLVFVIFYFLMIRPQQKQRKQHQTLLGGLKRGDEVVTSSGIHGKISSVVDNIVTVEIADNVRIKMEKQQVATVKPAAA